MKHIVAVLICVVSLSQTDRALATSCASSEDCFCGFGLGGQYALAVAQGGGAFLIQRAWGAGAEALPSPEWDVQRLDGGMVNPGSFNASMMFPGAKADAGTTLEPFKVGEVVMAPETTYVPAQAKVSQTQWLLYGYSGFDGKFTLAFWQVKGGLIRCKFADGPTWTVEKWLSYFAHPGCVANSKAAIPEPSCGGGCSMSSTITERVSLSGLLLMLVLVACVCRRDHQLQLVSKQSKHRH